MVLLLFCPLIFASPEVFRRTLEVNPSLEEGTVGWHYKLGSEEKDLTDYCEEKSGYSLNLREYPEEGIVFKKRIIEIACTVDASEAFESEGKYEVYATFQSGDERITSGKISYEHKGCSSCGGGYFDLNKCDEEECHGLGANCVYSPGTLGGSCGDFKSRGITSCDGYKTQADCEERDPGKFGCDWEERTLRGGRCVPAGGGSEGGEPPEETPKEEPEEEPPEETPKEETRDAVIKIADSEGNVLGETCHVETGDTMELKAIDGNNYPYTTGKWTLVNGGDFCSLSKKDVVDYIVEGKSEGKCRIKVEATVDGKTISDEIGIIVGRGSGRSEEEKEEEPEEESEAPEEQRNCRDDPKGSACSRGLTCYIEGTEISPEELEDLISENTQFLEIYPYGWEKVRVDKENDGGCVYDNDATIAFFDYFIWERFKIPRRITKDTGELKIDKLTFGIDAYNSFSPGDEVRLGLTVENDFGEEIEVKEAKAIINPEIFRELNRGVSIACKGKIPSGNEPEDYKCKWTLKATDEIAGEEAPALVEVEYEHTFLKSVSGSDISYGPLKIAVDRNEGRDKDGKRTGVYSYDLTFSNIGGGVMGITGIEKGGRNFCSDLLGTYLSGQSKGPCPTTGEESSFEIEIEYTYTDRLGVYFDVK
ncbi:MAG: hypothetical protein ACP5E4_02130 [Candidatus Aenigmatarchaeota archaeon]